MLASIAQSSGLFLPGAQRSGDFRVLFEVQAASGVPDIVLVHFDPAAVRRRERHGFPPVDDYLAVRVLSALREGPLSHLELAALLGVTGDYLRGTVLPQLSTVGHVQKTPASTWKLSHPFDPLARGICAIEVKRLDWKRGLTQARRYRRFANWTWVICDAVAADRACAHLPSFRRDGVGLATVDRQTQRSRVHFRAPWQAAPLTPYEFVLVAERAWSIHRNGGASGPVYPVFGVNAIASTEPDPRLQGAKVDRCLRA